MVLGSRNCHVSALRMAANHLDEAESVLVCGGEERGPDWLLERGLCSDRSFAYSMRLSAQAEGACACLNLGEIAKSADSLTHESWFDSLVQSEEEPRCPFVKWL